MNATHSLNSLGIIVRLLGLFLCLAAPARGATWYVDNAAGNDGSDGETPATAVATIARAVSLCGTSDTLALKNTGRPYHESIVLHQRGGTPQKPFTIEGNGAVLSGLRPMPAGLWQAKGNGLYFFPQPKIEIADLFARRRRTITPFITTRHGKLARGKTPDALKQDECCWTDAGAWFRPAKGRTPKDYDLAFTALESGLTIVNSSYICVRNLICEGFHNDGFNVHGDCQGIFGENLEARRNGDDGFSIHEDISAVVRNGWFHHNDNGIQDVNAGRSVYFGIVAEHNAGVGVQFAGGLHMLVDARVRHNGRQVVVNGGGARHLGLPRTNLSVAGFSILKNVVAEGGATALHVFGRGRAMASNCIFTAAETGVLVDRTAVCHITSSIVFACTKHELAIRSPDVRLGRNLYHPGRLSWMGKEYGPDLWEAWRTATGQDKESRLGRPEFMADGSLLLNIPADEKTWPAQMRLGLTRSVYGRVR